MSVDRLLPGEGRGPVVPPALLGLGPFDAAGGVAQDMLRRGALL